MFFRDSIKARRLEQGLQHHKLSGNLQGTDEELARLINIGSKLRGLPRATAPTPRHRRLYAASELIAPVATGLRLIDLASYIGGASLALGLLLTVVFAANSTPGTALHRYKSQTQDLRLKFVSNESTRASMQLRLVEDRTEETKQVLYSNADTETKAAALSEMAAQTKATVERVRDVAIAQNNSELLDKLDTITKSQLDIISNVKDESAADAKRTALEKTEANTKVVAEAKRMVAAANDSTIAELPGPTITISGTISKLDGEKITIGSDTFSIDAQTEIFGKGNSNTQKVTLKQGQQIRVTATDTKEGMIAKSITVVYPEQKEKAKTVPTKIVPTDEELEPDTIPETVNPETPTVQSGFQIEDPTPLYSPN